jgi:DNA topoisomerase-2
MAIWSFTAERLEKLREAIEKKKAEHDELLARSERDLWCEDLDEFMVEWDKQMAIDAEIQTKIRRMGRRASKKIGAGKSRKGKDDDEYEPEKKSRAKPKAAPKAASTAAPKGKLVQSTSAQRFADMFGSKSKVKKESSDVIDLSDDFSDDDFMSLSRKPAATQSSRAPSVSASQSMSQAPSQSEEPEARGKRAAASKARTLFDADSESEADDDEMAGEVDIGAMVKGIDEPAEEKSRVGLHKMTKQESSSSGSADKTKVKSAKSFDFDDDSDTNTQEEAPVSKADIIDSLLSEDDGAKNPEPPGLAGVKKIARPAAKPKPKAKPAPKAKASSAKPSTLSPAAKAYAARQAVKKSVYDEDSEDDIAAPGSPSPKRAAPARARARPGRAAAARKPVVVDDEDSVMVDEQSESDDPFEMDDDDD